MAFKTFDRDWDLDHKKLIEELKEAREESGHLRDQNRKLRNELNQEIEKAKKVAASSK